MFISVLLLCAVLTVSNVNAAAVTSPRVTVTPDGKSITVYIRRTSSGPRDLDVPEGELAALLSSTVHLGIDPAIRAFLERAAVAHNPFVCFGEIIHGDDYPSCDSRTVPTFEEAAERWGENGFDHHTDICSSRLPNLVSDGGGAVPRSAAILLRAVPEAEAGRAVEDSYLVAKELCKYGDALAVLVYNQSIQRGPCYRNVGCFEVFREFLQGCGGSTWRRTQLERQQQGRERWVREVRELLKTHPGETRLGFLSPGDMDPEAAKEGFKRALLGVVLNTTGDEEGAQQEMRAARMLSDNLSRHYGVGVPLYKAEYNNDRTQFTLTSIGNWRYGKQEGNAKLPIW